jgi:single-strand DNA-binding protein
MSLPNLSGTARLYNDVEMRFTPNGMAISKVPLVFNSRKKNQQTQEWEDGDSFFVTGLLFKDRAEEAVERLAKGDEVVVSGRVKTNSWEDKDGNKRSTTELLLDSIGLTPRSLTKKAERSGERGSASSFGQQPSQPQGGFGQQGGQQPPQGGGNPPADDPWATGGQASGGGFSDSPPF